MSSVSWVRQRSSRSECLRWNTYQKTSDQNDQSALARRRVENKRLRATPGYFSCCAAPKAYPFPPEKEAPNSKPALVVLTAFLAPSKAIAFGHTPLRWGWQDENLILGELGLGRTRGEMKAGSSAIAANLVVGAGSRRVYSIIPGP